MSNKVIEYLITAKDKTAAAVKSATANANSYANAVKNTGEAAKQAGNDALEAFNPMDAIFNAASGNIQGVSKQIAGLISKMTGLKMSMMAVGLYAALIVVVVKAFQAFNQAIIDSAKSVSELKNYNFDQYMKQLAKEQADYNKELERTNKALQEERTHEDALAEIAKNRQLAQLEIERQKKIAEGGNRDEINEQFNQRKAEIESGFNADKSRNEVARLGDDIDSLYKQIDDIEGELPTLKRYAKEQIRLSSSSLQKSNNSWFNKDEYNELAKTHNENAQKALEQIQQYKDKIADIEQQIQAKENRIAQINAGTGVRGLEEQASQMERDNAVDERLKKEEEAHEEEIKNYYEELAKWQEEQERMMLDAVREEEAARMDMIRKEHNERLANQQAEIQAAQQEQQQAQNRLQAAQAATATAWGWYRDKNYGAMNSAIDLQKREAEAQQSFDKDFAKLKSKFGSGWRTVDFDKMTDDQNAVRQVALAREEEEAARKWAEETAANTAAAAEALAELKRIFEEGE